MNSLNKKLTESKKEIWNSLLNQKLSTQAIHILIFIMIESILTINVVWLILAYIPAIGISLFMSQKYMYIQLIISLLILSILAQRTTVLIITAALLVTLFIYRFLQLRYSENISLLILANLAHLGDAITTYKGLKLGFSEQNPFVLVILENLGYVYIFIIKFVVLPITAYIYLTMPNKTTNITLKAIFLIGFYLTISNLVVIV